MLKGGLVLIWELHMNLVPTLLISSKTKIVKILTALWAGMAVKRHFSILPHESKVRRDRRP